MFGDDGQLKLLAAILPREEIIFTDGWHVQGLKGTGSYDYNVQTCSCPNTAPSPSSPGSPTAATPRTFRMGLMPITAAGHAAWALGVAKSMLDDVGSSPSPRPGWATWRRSPTGRRSSAASPTTSRCGGRPGCWSSTPSRGPRPRSRAGESLTPHHRADMRVAATYATEACREVAQWAHLAAGTTAIREGSRLERAFRDIYTGTQHAFISEKTYLDAAQVMLGLVADSPGL